MVRALICYICYLDSQLAFEKAAVRFSPMVVLELEYLYEIVWDQRYDPDSNPFPIIAEIAIGETWTRDPFDRLIVSMPRPTDGLAWSLRMNSSPGITQTPFGKRRPSVRVWPWARPAYTEGSRLWPGRSPPRRPARIADWTPGRRSLRFLGGTSAPSSVGRRSAGCPSIACRGPVKPECLPIPTNSPIG